MKRDKRSIAELSLAIGIPLLILGGAFALQGMRASHTVHSERCASVAAYFARFHNPFVVANMTYYIFRESLDNFVAPNWNLTASAVLSSPEMRTATFPPFTNTTYFWTVIQNPQNWQVVELPMTTSNFKVLVEPKDSGHIMVSSRLRTRTYMVEAEDARKAEDKAIEKYLAEVRADIKATAIEKVIVVK